MARRDLLDFQLAPYCWRVLVPWIAKLQPWSIQAGFFSVTLASLVATGPVIYFMVRSGGATRSAATAIVVLFFSLGWAARYSLSDFWVPDATAMLLTCTAMWMVISKRWYLAAVTIAIGVCAKESVVFVAPLAFTWHARGLTDWSAWRRAVLSGAPAILIVIGLRLLIQPENGNGTYLASMPPEISRFPELFGDYNYATRFQEIVVDDRWAHRDWNDLDRYLVDPFGLPLLLLAVAGAIVAPRRLLRLSPFFVLVYAQLFFASDSQRLLVLAFPALAMLCGLGLTKLGAMLRVGEWAVAGVVAGVFVLSLLDANEFGAEVAPQVAVLAAGLIAARILEYITAHRAAFRRTRQ